MIIIAASVTVGGYFVHRLRRRQDILSSYIRLLNNAASKIAYTAEDLYTVFSDNFAGFIFDRDKPFDSQWRQLADSFGSVLDEGDRAVLYDISRELGTSDTDSQLRMIQLSVNRLEERLTNAKENVKAKCRLYRVLSVAIGTVISIMIV